MSRKISTRNLKVGLFAFVDLLGFSARVKSINDTETLGLLDEDVRHVQESFQHKSSDKLVRESHKFLGKRVLAFSDCITVSVPLGSVSTKWQGSFDVLMAEISDLALAQGGCVQRGIFLRGGVDIGYWFHRKDTLISPALVDAYELEKSACVPMIAITPRLREYLSEHQGRSCYSEEADPLSRLFFEGGTLPNGQVHYFVNYIRACLEAIEPAFTKSELAQYSLVGAGERDRLRNSAWLNACRAWALHHNKKIIEAHAAATRDDVRAKYVWLSHYHNKEIARFFGSEASSLLIELG